jgi:hypothetical protein
MDAICFGAYDSELGLRWKTTTIAAFIWPENWISTSGRAKNRSIAPRRRGLCIHVNCQKTFFIKSVFFLLRKSRALHKHRLTEQLARSSIG